MVYLIRLWAIDHRRGIFSAKYERVYQSWYIKLQHQLVT
jgi:hypothetical protein